MFGFWISRSFEAVRTGKNARWRDGTEKRLIRSDSLLTGTVRQVGLNAMEDIKPWEGGPWVPLMNDSSAGRLFLLKASGPTRPRFTPTTATTKRRKVLPDSLLRSSSGAWRKNIIVSE